MNIKQKENVLNSKELFYPEARFGGFTDIDGTMAFFNRVNALIDLSFVVLDVGCGRGEYKDDSVHIRKSLRNLKGKVAKVIGIDVDQCAENNPFLDEFHLIESGPWPIEEDSIDLVVCDNVLEHIGDPDLFFKEVRRVLRDSGFLCIRTPNRWSYVSLMARLIPNKYHSRVITLVQDGRKEEDVFPTFYNCNSIGKIKKMMKMYGLQCVVYGYESEPHYLSFSRIAYFFGVLHQRFAPGFMKPAIFAFGRLKKVIT